MSGDNTHAFKAPDDVRASLAAAGLTADRDHPRRLRHVARGQPAPLLPHARHEVPERAAWEEYLMQHPTGTQAPSRAEIDK